MRFPRFAPLMALGLLVASCAPDVLPTSPGGVEGVGGKQANLATVTNLTVRPSSTVYDANNVAGVAADAAPGFALGSLASNGVAKTDMYFTPAMLFGRDILVSEIANIRYYTKKGTTHAADPADWFLAIYTKPFAGDMSTPTWYGSRFGSEPYFSNNIADPVNSWNQWSSDGASNTLRFFESTAGAPGATFGSYADPDWATFVTGNSLGTATNRGSQSVLSLSIQTASAWSAGFTGQLDGFRVELTDGSVATVNFEPNAVPCTLQCYVSASGGDDSNGGTSIADAKKTIQAALNTVQANGTVRVLPGTYNETAPGSVTTSLGGTYQFGLFFGSAKPGITLMGVTASDAAITNAAATQATINTNATNNFGTSGTFVEANNTTISGLKLGPNASGDNKTIEVVADNFTLKYCATAIPDGGAIYLSEYDSPAGLVSSYHITDNLFADATQIAISSGAGQTSLVAGREILRNTWAMGGETWPAISFNGTGGVPWFTKTVGGAIIANNTFAGGGEQYIRARGSYIEAQFDWKSWWDNNSYDKGTVALVTEAPWVVRSYSYVSGPYTLTNVRRIGSTIQDEVLHTIPGSDIVLAKAGSYPENVQITNSGMRLTGTGMDLTTIIGPMTGSGNTLEISASGANAIIEGVAVTRAGNNPTDWNSTIKNQGVAIYGNGSTLRNAKITGNRNGVFVYGASNVKILNNTIDFNRTGVHLVNDVTGLMIKNNFITNNWTMGILFRDEGSPDAGPVTITDNNISGNWYSQVEGRSLFGGPALNVTGNWLGTQTPTVAVAPNSSEPGYSAQIPAAYGGSAVAPGGTPTIIYNGLNASNPINYIPFLCSGVDAAPATTGFQPVSGALSPCDNSGPITTATPPAPAPINSGVTIPVSISDLTTGNSPLLSYTWTRNGLTPITVTFGTSAVTQNFNLVLAASPTAHVDNICVKGTDVFGNVGAESCVLAVWYDPSAGFVTGGGWINSPAGAYTPNPSLTGKANFGFVSKYQKGKTEPTGNTEFQFNAANLKFKGTAMEWLVISGAKAQYKGSGTINGDGDYRFMLTAIDGSINGGGGSDKFRIRIWNNAGGGLVYDNQLNAPDSADPTTLLGGGNIIIHK